MKVGNEVTAKISPAPYLLSIASFIISLVLLLLAVLDIRRGFLFSSTGYFVIGSPAALLRFSVAQLPLLLAGGVGVWLSHDYMRKYEQSFAGKLLNLKTAATVFAVIIVALLLIDMLIFRSIATVRALIAGSVPGGATSFGHIFVIPVDEMPGWLQPAGEGLNHILFIWHSLVVGIFLGSLILVAANSGFIARLKGNGIKAHLLGVAMALPTPFSAVCAAPIGGVLYQRGASLGPVLAFSVAAPMLNITSLILAAATLPPEFALFRIISGIIVSVFLTYFISLIASRWANDKRGTYKNARLVFWATKLNSAFSRLFHFNKLLITEIPESPSDLVLSWLKMAGRLAMVVFPILFITAPLTMYVVNLMPATANNLQGIILTSFFGTMIMSPAWSEIAFARGMLYYGFPALAAASLIVLPAVSIPSMIIIAGAIGRMRVVVLTAFVIFLAGITAGLLFL